MSEMMSCIFQVILHNFYKTSSEHEHFFSVGNNILGRHLELILTNLTLKTSNYHFFFHCMIKMIFS